MNPSTQDIAEAIQEANAENVLILPNNKTLLWLLSKLRNLLKST